MKTKKLTFAILLALTALFMAYGEAYATLPRDYQEFKARYQEEGQTPEGTAHLYFEAVYCYLNKDTRPEGSKMLRYVMDLPYPVENFPTRTFVERLQNESYHHIFRSYAVGTTPENDYIMSPDNFKLNIESSRKEGDYIILGLRSSGADSPRLLNMKQIDGLWYVSSSAGIHSEIRPPKSVVDARNRARDADYD